MSFLFEGCSRCSKTSTTIALDQPSHLIRYRPNTPAVRPCAHLLSPVSVRPCHAPWTHTATWHQPVREFNQSGPGLTCFAAPLGSEGDPCTSVTNSSRKTGASKHRAWFSVRNMAFQSAVACLPFCGMSSHVSILQERGPERCFETSP